MNHINDNHLEGVNTIEFSNLFNLEEIQHLQQLFSEATGVASVITRPDGTPITNPTNFCKLCEHIIRKTDKGKTNCFKSDALLGVNNPAGAIVQPCFSGGLWDAGVSITVGGHHVANWIIGQVRTELNDDQKLMAYAEEIGACKEDFRDALLEVPVMSLQRFQRIADMLFVFANELSEKAYRFLDFEKQIVEHEFAKSKLEEKDYFLNETQDIAKLGTYILDINTGIWESSKILDTIFGIPADFDKSVEGWTSIIHPEWQNIMRNYFIDDVIGGKCKFDKEYQIVRIDDQRERWVHGMGKLKMDSDNQPVFMLGTIIDITDKKEVELLLKLKNDEIETQNEEYMQLNEELLQINEELHFSKEHAEESDRLKTAFLQNMSHEIRTPMNAIMGFSGLLVSQYNNKPKLEKYAEIINQRCSDLLGIINDILDIAKIESGQLSVNREECNLSELFSELNQFFIEYQKRIGKDHIGFILHCTCNIRENIIFTDKIKLKQIFINLINNAFKFTATGKIEYGCKFDEHHNLIFYVADTGIGIPDDKKRIIFERFTQLQTDQIKNTGGNGLGLSIVKGLIDLLGGKIFLDSEPEKGSTFTFYFPYKTITTEISKNNLENQEMIFHFEDRKVLIVEDDIYNTEYLREILIDSGLTIWDTAFGKQAIDLAITHSFDLILMDIRLGDMDGYEVSRQIRSHNQNVKIIAQTAYASFKEKQTALDAGCNDYISKPINRIDLLSMIQAHLTKAY